MGCSPPPGVRTLFGGRIAARAVSGAKLLDASLRCTRIRSEHTWCCRGAGRAGAEWMMSGKRHRVPGCRTGTGEGGRRAHR